MWCHPYPDLESFSEKFKSWHMPLLIHHFCLLICIIFMPGLAAIVFELKDGDAALSRLWGFAFRFVWCSLQSSAVSNKVACVCDSYPMFGLHVPVESKQGEKCRPCEKLGCAEYEQFNRALCISWRWDTTGVGSTQSSPSAELLSLLFAWIWRQVSFSMSALCSYFIVLLRSGWY